MLGLMLGLVLGMLGTLSLMLGLLGCMLGLGPGELETSHAKASQARQEARTRCRGTHPSPCMACRAARGGKPQAPRNQGLSEISLENLRN